MGGVLKDAVNTVLSPLASLGSAITGINPETGRADQGGLNDGHTTSGMDKALQDHADKIHPVKGK